MNAGRELDALVAEKVMGWKPDPARCRLCGWPLSDGMCTPDNCSLRPLPIVPYDIPPDYSTDIAAAWQVVEHLRERDIWLDSLEQKWESEMTRVIFGWRDPERGALFAQEMGDTPAHAICLAALRAVGMEIPV
jgi:hypothetical protein